MSIAAALKLSSLSLVMLSLAASGAAADTDAGSCEPDAMTYKAMTDVNTVMNGTSFANVSGMSRTFRQGGTAASCVVVTFSAIAFTSNGETLFVEARLDDDAICSPFGGIFVANRTDPASYSMTYVCSAVSTGRHSVTMQAKTDGGTNVTLSNRSMVVQYTK